MRKNFSFSIFFISLLFLPLLGNANNQNDILKDGLIGEYLFRDQDINEDGYYTDAVSGDIIYTNKDSNPVKKDYITHGLNGINYMKSYPMVKKGATSLSFWMFSSINQSNSTFGYILYDDNSNSYKSIYLKYGNLYEKTFEGRNGKTTMLASSINLPEQKWNNITISGNKMFLNGVLIKDGMETIKNHYLRASGGYSSYYKTYDRELTQSEVSIIYNKEKDNFNSYNSLKLTKNDNAPSEGLLGHFKFELNLNNEKKLTDFQIRQSDGYGQSYLKALKGYAFRTRSMDILNIDKKIKVISFLYGEDGTINFGTSFASYKPYRMGVGDSFVENEYCKDNIGCYATLVFQNNKVYYYINGHKVMHKSGVKNLINRIGFSGLALDELRIYDENLPDSEIPKLINLYSEKAKGEITITEGLNDKKQYEISAKSNVGSVTGYSITNSNICDDSLSFISYSSKITLTNSNDNGKKVCFKAENEGNAIFKMSSVISGIPNGSSGGETGDKTTPVEGSDLYHNYKKWHSSDSAVAYDQYFVILDSTIHKNLYYAKTPVFNKFIDLNSDGKPDFIHIERRNFDNSYVQNGVNYYESKVIKKYSVLIDEGNGVFTPKYRCVYEYSSDGRGDYESKYYGDCAK